MSVIHYRKTMVGMQTWCGVWRNPAEGPHARDNSSPSKDEVTCKKCLKAAADWLAAYKNRKAAEKIERGRPKMSYLSEKIYQERKEAEAKAIDSLSRYKFQMFGYWAGVWVHLNRISEDPQPNPFTKLVKLAKEMRGD